MLNTIKKHYLAKRSLSLNTFLVFFSIATVLLFLLFFFYLPLIKIFKFAFFDNDQFTTRFIYGAVTSATNLRFINFSLYQALLSTVFCLVLGLPVGYFFAKYNFKGKNLLVNILTIPFVLPPIVVLLGFVITYGSNGWINYLWKIITGSNRPLVNIFGTFEGILMAHVFYNICVIIRLSIPAWKSIDQDLVDVSRTLGASRWFMFRRIILPQVINYLISAALLVFIYTFNSFAIILYLGEVRYQTIEVRIYKLLTKSLKFGEGTALAIVQLLINTLVIIVYLIFERKTRRMALGKEKSFQEQPLFTSFREWKRTIIIIIFILYTTFIAFFTLAPIVAVLVKSFIPAHPSVSPFWGYQKVLSSEYYPLLNNKPINLLINTIWFASLNTIITIILSVALVFVLRNKFLAVRSYKRSKIEAFVSYLIILPMATSSVTLAIGLYLQFQKASSYPTIVWIFIVLAHVLISIPFATRSIMASYNRIDVELLNVASTLGASRLMIFHKVELPLIKNGIIVGGIFSFAISVGEFGATRFLVRTKFSTLALGIYTLLETQTIQLSAAMASLLIIVTVVCFVLIDRLGNIELKV